MARNFQNLKIGAEKISGGCFFDHKIRLHRFDLEREAKIAKKFAIGNHRHGERVTPDGTAELALDPGNILHMIDMPVRQEQKFEIDRTRTHPFASALRRVEENPSLRRLKQVAIRFKNAAAKALVIHSLHILAGRVHPARKLFKNWRQLGLEFRLQAVLHRSRVNVELPTSEKSSWFDSSLARSST